MTTLAYWRGAKNYQSVRYAYVWCERYIEWEPETNWLELEFPDTDMRELYREYARDAHHFGHVAKKFRHHGGIIQPVDFTTWYEIFCRVYGRL
jgi:hypothetical protein